MNKILTPHEFREIRMSLGLTQQRMAETLGYEGRAAISQLENGFRDITPRTTITMNLLMEKHNDKLAQRT